MDALIAAIENHISSLNRFGFKSFDTTPFQSIIDEYHIEVNDDESSPVNKESI